MFQRVHSDERCDGSGVGLAVARTIAERHGGRLWRFRVTLPSAA